MGVTATVTNTGERDGHHVVQVRARTDGQRVGESVTPAPIAVSNYAPSWRTCWVAVSQTRPSPVRIYLKASLLPSISVIS